MIKCTGKNLYSSLLSKAKRAIEALKLKIEQLQNEDSAKKNAQQELEMKIDHMKQSSSQIENSYQLQINELQDQLQNVRNSLQGKENERNLYEAKLVSSIYIYWFCVYGYIDIYIYICFLSY